MEKNAKVYSYLRFSDPRQSSGSSADRQLQYAAQWAAEHGLQLDDRLSLRDEGLSAYHQRHITQGALGVFMAAVEAGQIAPGSVLIVEGLDRLSRAEPIQAQAQLAQIINAGITVVTASDGKQYNRERLKSNPMDLVFSLLVMIRAHEESDTKSKRVKAALMRQIKGWQDGTYRGRIVNGKDPQWLRWNGERFEEIPERTAALRLALSLYRSGLGGRPVLLQLAERGMQLNDKGLPTAPNFYRLLQNHALYGARHMEVDDQTYALADYYPAIITPAEFSEIQAMIGDRTKTGRAPKIQSVLTGMALLRCGYCGKTLAGQNVGGKRLRDDGLPHDGHRRIMCVGSHRVDGRACPVGGSCSIVPIENAIIDYCSDQMNLSSLTSNRDLTTPIRNALLAARAAAHTIESQLANLTAALMQADSASLPRTFMQKAQQLETELDTENKRIADLEHELMTATQHQASPTAASEWASLVEGVKTLDPDARLKAKRLISETFSRIVIYTNGLSPKSGRNKAADAAPIDLILFPKGGQPRSLRINRKTGAWITGEDY